MILFGVSFVLIFGRKYLCFAIKKLKYFFDFEKLLYKFRVKF